MKIDCQNAIFDGLRTTFIQYASLTGLSMYMCVLLMQVSIRFVVEVKYDEKGVVMDTEE